MKFIVTHQVRKAGAIGTYTEGQFTIEAPTPERAREIAFDAWHARGCETSGFCVHDDTTFRLVLGGGLNVCGRYSLEANRVQAGR